MFVEKRPREITAPDVQLLEPDLLGAITMMLYGRGRGSDDNVSREPWSFRTGPNRSARPPSTED